MVLSTTAAGIISQIARGLAILLTISWSEVAPTAFAFTRSCTAWVDRSNTTQEWPLFNRRFTILAPMRPRPTIPNSIELLLLLSLLCLLAVAADEIVGGRIVLQCSLRLFD